jgi:methylaspartate ammonia-lyase
MRIKEAIFSNGRTGFFFDDQRAIRNGAVPDGAAYLGKPATPGFEAVRQAGESVSVMLVLEDGQIADGDCAAVQYSGAGGRDPLFLAADYLPVLRDRIAPLLVGRDVSVFRPLAAEVDALVDPATGHRLHTALRYGVTQALLDATARSRRLLMAEVVADEYGTQVLDRPVPIFGQCGDDRYVGVDKMILKQVDVLPHGLFNSIAKTGGSGEGLLGYVRWLRERIAALRPDPSYLPTLHLDVYGTLGLIFDRDPSRIFDFLSRLEHEAGPHLVHLEGPVDTDSREGTLDALAELTRRVDDGGLRLRIVADEWCNTLEDIRDFADARAGHILQIKTPDLGGIQNVVEAVLYCRAHGIGAYQGGTCNETDRSARVCVHLAMATHPDLILAKPGMGFDEGFMGVYNEMHRILALRARKGAPVQTQGREGGLR